MNANPKISIVIPVYNPGKHLYKCLDSIANQTYKNLEIILIDDGSTDGSSSVCDEYQKKDSRVKVKHIENSGVSHARNVGIEMITGDYVHFPDSDDYIDLDTYEVLIKTIEKENVDAVCFEHYVTYENNEIRHVASDGKYGIFDAEGSVYELLFSNRPFLWSKFFSARVVKDIRFYENIYRGEDGLFAMMALHNVGSCAFINKPLYHYVQSEESACRGEFRPSQLSAIDAIPIYEKFLAENYPSMISKERRDYLHLLIMLYVDMSVDKKDYREEKKRVLVTYKTLRKQIHFKDIEDISDKVKFTFFELSPKLFCIVHNIRFR